MRDVDAGTTVVEQGDANMPRSFNSKATDISARFAGAITGAAKKSNMPFATRSNNVKRVASAVGEGAIAISLVHRVLQEQATAPQA
jgi:hypothetical protein